MPSIGQIQALVEQIKNDLPLLIQRSQVTPNQIVVGGGLSDISERLGLLQAGEFRTGNGNEPGFGFSGVRIGYPAFVYESETWNFVGVNDDVLQVGISAEDGKMYFGAGTGILDAEGITIIAEGLFSDDNGYKFKDANGDTIGGTYGVGNLGAQQITVSLRAQDLVATYVNSVASVDATAGSLARARVTADSGSYSGDAAILTVQQSGTGSTMITSGMHIIDLQALSTVIFNNLGEDVDFRIESDTNLDAFFLDASAETAHFFGSTGASSVLTIDGGTDHRVEIGADHYFPTRDSSNPNGFWNEANQDMDFTFEGTTDDNLLKIDAALNTVGIGGAPSILHKLKVTGTSHITGDLILDGDANIGGNFIVAGSVTVGNGLSWDGWTPVTEAWTRTGNHVFTVPGDLTLKYRKGTKVRYQDGGVNEHGVVGSSSHAAGTTTVNLIPNTDVAMAATTITSRYISYIERPEGFPQAFNYTASIASSGGTITTSTLNLAKWNVSGDRIFVHILDTINTQGTASGSVQLGLPIAALHNEIGYGRENALNGAMLQGVTSGAFISMLTYNNLSPFFGNGSIHIVDVNYLF